MDKNILLETSNTIFEIDKKMVQYQKNILNNSLNPYLCISENAVKMIKENYNWELITEDYIKVFRKYVKEFYMER